MSRWKCAGKQTAERISLRNGAENGKEINKKERNWILYDVGNSAFTLLIATILPIYFNYLAGYAGISSVDYLAYWGYAASIGTIIVALAGPVLGTMADTKGFKSRFLRRRF